MEVPEAEGQPGVDIHGHGVAPESAEGCQIDGERVANHLVEETGVDMHLELRQALGSRVAADGESMVLMEAEVGPGDPVRTLCGAQPPKLLPKANQGPSGTGAVGDSESFNEVLEGVPQVDLLGLVADHLGRQKRKQ